MKSPDTRKIPMPGINNMKQKSIFHFFLEV